MSLAAGAFPLKQKPEAYVLLVSVSCENNSLPSDTIGTTAITLAFSSLHFLSGSFLWCMFDEPVPCACQHQQEELALDQSMILQSPAGSSEHGEVMSWSAGWTTCALPGCKPALL